MRRIHGFTLIELLVVISLVALLLSLLLPALSHAKDVTMDLRCKAVLRGMSQAASVYATDNKQWLPHGGSPYTYAMYDPGRPWFIPDNQVYYYSAYWVGKVYSPQGYPPFLGSAGQLMLDGYLPERKEAFGCPQNPFQQNGTYNSSPLITDASVYVAYKQALDPGSVYYYRNCYQKGIAINAGITYSIRGPVMNLENLRSAVYTSAATYDGSSMLIPSRAAFFADNESASQSLLALIGSASGTSPLPYWAMRHRPGFNVAYIDGHTQLFEDPTRSKVWSYTYDVGNYGSQIAMPLMDLK